MPPGPAAVVAMDLPESLQKLLMREAHLRLSRASIEPALARADAAMTALEKRRPGLMAGKAKQEQHQQELAGLRQARDLLRAGLDQLERVEAHLAKLLLGEAENYCRAVYPEYVRGLAIRKHQADWLQWLERFSGKVADLTRALGNLRNTVCAGYSREQHTYSPFAIQALPPARQGALDVEAEIKFANEIAALQEQVLGEVGVQAPSVPRMPEANYSRRVEEIMLLPLPEAQPEFDRIIDEVKQLQMEGIPHLREQANEAGHSQDEIIDGFVALRLDEMRQQIAPTIDPAETDESVADSERWCEEARLRGV